MSYYNSILGTHDATFESRMISKAPCFEDYDPDLRKRVIDKVKYTLTNYGDWNYTDHGVKKIVDTWFERKQTLLATLANHPDYDREHFCIRLNHTKYQRTVDERAIGDFQFWLPQTEEIWEATGKTKKLSEVRQLRKALMTLTNSTNLYIKDGEENLLISNYYNIPKLNPHTMEIEYRPIEVQMLNGAIPYGIDYRYALPVCCYPYQKTYDRLFRRVLKEVKADIIKANEGEKVKFRYIDPNYSFNSMDVLSEAHNRLRYSTVEEILRKYNIRFSAGQKRTKVVLKVVRELGLTLFPEFNKEYSKYCDAINPLDVEMDSVLSANIIDYLLQSNGDSWSSCHNIAKYSNRGEAYGGCNCAGAVSYALDDVSLIYYTNTKESLSEWGDGIDYVDKHTRAMIYMGHDLEYFVMSCVYPSRDERLREQALPIVEKILADTLVVPNFWKSCNYKQRSSDHIQCLQAEGNCAYNDWLYDYFHGKIIWINDKDESEMMDITIGAPKICPVCGDEDETDYPETGTLYCEECIHVGEVRCELCGEWVDEDEAYYSSYHECWLCDDCSVYSEYLEDYIYESEARYVESIDSYVPEEMTGWCDLCDEYDLMDDMVEGDNGNEYCSACVDLERVGACENCGIYNPSYKLCYDDVTEKYYCRDCYDELIEAREEGEEKEEEVA